MSKYDEQTIVLRNNLYTLGSKLREAGMNRRVERRSIVVAVVATVVAVVATAAAVACNVEIDTGAAALRSKGLA